MFQVPSVISKFTTLVDNTIRLTVDCQELNDIQAVELLKLKGKIGWFTFKSNPIKETEIPNEIVEFKGEKSPSKRLRDHLYIYWRDNTNRKLDFDSYWKSWVNQKCEEIKDKLN